MTFVGESIWFHWARSCKKNVDIYKQLFTCHSAVLAELAQALVESVKRASRFIIYGTKVKVSRKVFHYGSLKASFRQLLLEICIVRKRTVRDMLF